MELHGKKIIVTGAAQGIGASALRAYVAAGAHVAAMDIDAAQGEAIAASATAKGPGSAFFIACDVGDRAMVDAAFDAAVARLGGLDVLAHIAGVHRHAATHDVPDETLAWLFNVNVNGTIYTNGAAYRHMPDGGSIINFGSESGLTAEINNIRMNAVLPYIVTPMYARFREALSPEDLAAHDKATAEQIPLGGKFGDADVDLAPVLLFLASDGSRFITGQLIPVDGGLISVR